MYQLPQGFKLLKKEIQPDGKEVYCYKFGKLNMTVIYPKKSSPDAIQNFNDYYNSLANKYVNKLAC